MIISVIIPIYNAAPFVERCLTSVLAQTYKKFEMILIDDFCSDNSMAIVKRLLLANPGVSYQIIRHDNNKGLSAARNSGIKAATGTYLFFLDADDWIPAEALERLVETARLSNPHQELPHLVVGEVSGFPQDNKALHLAPSLPSFIDGGLACAQVILLRQIPIMACNKLVLKEWLLMYDLFFQEGLIHEDNAWSFTIASFVQQIAICRHVTYYYYMNPKGITGSALSPKRLQSFRTLITEQLAIMKAQEAVFHKAERPVSTAFELRLHQQSYVLFSAAWMLYVLYGNPVPTFKEERTFIRNSIRSFPFHFFYMRTRDQLLWLLIFLPTWMLYLAKKIN